MNQATFEFWIGNNEPNQLNSSMLILFYSQCLSVAPRMCTRRIAGKVMHHVYCYKSVVFEHTDPPMWCTLSIMFNALCAQIEIIDSVLECVYIFSPHSTWCRAAKKKRTTFILLPCELCINRFKPKITNSFVYRNKRYDFTLFSGF